MIGSLRRALVALLRGETPPPPSPSLERSEEPADRLDAAKDRLKETIPPPEDE